MNVAELRSMCIDDFQHDSIVSRFSRYLVSAQERINRDLTVRPIDVSDYRMFSTPPYPIPDDLKVINRLMIVENGNEYTVDYSSVLPVERDTATVGRPRTFCVQDQVIMLYPTPDKAYDMTLYYTPMIKRLVADSDTNWLLNRASDIYRYAVLAEAAVFLKDAAQMGFYLSLYDGAWQPFQSQIDRERFPTDVPMRIRTLSSTGREFRR